MLPAHLQQRTNSIIHDYKCFTSSLFSCFIRLQIRTWCNYVRLRGPIPLHSGRLRLQSHWISKIVFDMLCYKGPKKIVSFPKRLTAERVSLLHDWTGASVDKSIRHMKEWWVKQRKCRFFLFLSLPLFPCSIRRSTEINLHFRSTDRHLPSITAALSVLWMTNCGNFPSLRVDFSFAIPASLIV